MKVGVQEITPVKRAITVEVPEGVVEEQMSKAYSTLRKNVRIPGFRPGHAPLPLLEKKYGGSVEADVLQRLIPEFYQKALEETGLVPVTSPLIEKVELKKNAPLQFTATVEIMPQVTLADYRGIRLTKKAVDVTPSDVEEALARLREAHARLEAVPEDHPAGEKDWVLMDFEGVIDGKPQEGMKASGYLAEIGSHSLVPGFEEQLIGRKKGGRAEIKIQFPATDGRPEVAGKEVTFHVEVKEVKRKVLPPLDDSLAKEVGSGETLAELREKVKEHLQAQREREAAQAVRDEALRHLTQMHSCDVPPSLVERELRTMAKMIQAPQGREESASGGEELPPEMRQELEPVARERVKGQIILESIAKTEGIDPTPSELDEEIRKLSEALRKPLPEVRRMFSSREGSLAWLKARRRREKALDHVLSQAIIT